MYIANSQTHTIIAWQVGATSGTTFVGCNATYGGSTNRLRNPRDVKRDASGNLYVLDSSNLRVLLVCSGSSNPAPRSIIDLDVINSNGFALDASLNIYVTDSNNHRIVKYNRIMWCFTRQFAPTCPQYDQSFTTIVTFIENELTWFKTISVVISLINASILECRCLRIDRPIEKTWAHMNRYNNMPSLDKKMSRRGSAVHGWSISQSTTIRHLNSFKVMISNWIDLLKGDSSPSWTM